MLHSRREKDKKDRSVILKRSEEKKGSQDTRRKKSMGKAEKEAKGEKRGRVYLNWTENPSLLIRRE